MLKIIRRFELFFNFDEIFLYIIIIATESKVKIQNISLMKILLYILLFFMFFIEIENIKALSATGKYLNLIIEDDLQYPLSLLINKFVSRSDLVINARYVSKDYIKNLSYDNGVNIIITQNRNKEFIEKNFNIKSDVFFGNTGYCLCSREDEKLLNYNFFSMTDFFKYNFFNKIATGNHNSNFFIGELQNINRMSLFENSDEAIQSIYLKKNDLGLFLYPMCVKEKNLKIAHFLSDFDAMHGNLTTRSVEYRIYVVNYFNSNVQFFLSFITNSQYIHDLLKNYGIVSKARQFNN